MSDAWNRLADLLVLGGKGGPGARPMHPDWVREIRDQCAAQGVAFFFKQWGGFRPKAGGREWTGGSGANFLDAPILCVPLNI